MLIKQDRKIVSLFVRAISGHCFLARHEMLVHKTDYNSSLCRFCRREGVSRQETPEHIIKYCMYFDDIRRRIFGEIVLGETTSICWEKLIKFLRQSGYKDLETESSLEEHDNRRREMNDRGSEVDTMSHDGTDDINNSGSLASGELNRTALDLLAGR